MGQSNGVLFEELGFCISKVSFNRGFTVYTVLYRCYCVLILTAKKFHQWKISIYGGFSLL